MQNDNTTKNVLVINCGSSSVKFSLINPTTGKAILNAIAERLNSPQAILKITLLDKNYVEKKQITEQEITSPHTHKVAIELLVDFLKLKTLISQVQAIGHRVVHGGEIYGKPTLITNNVIDDIDKLSQLAPLHNPANVIGIKAAKLAFREASRAAKAVIMEPIMKLEVLTPEENMGDIVGDLNRRRGQVNSMDDRAGSKVVAAEVPLSEMFGYVTSLRTLSSGRATSTMEFSHYAETPSNISESVISEIKGNIQE